MKRNSNGRHTRTVRRPAQTSAKHPMLRRAGLVSGALATIAGGVGVGAAMMYVFDPQSGARRRATMQKAARGAAQLAIDETRGAVDSAYGMAHAAKDEARSIGSRVMHELRTHRQYAGDAVQSLHDSAHHVLSHRHARRHRLAAAATVIGAVGFVAAGIGVVSLLDADRRRRMIGMAGCMMNETGDLIGRTGRYIRDMAGGTSDETIDEVAPVESHDSSPQITMPQEHYSAQTE